MIISLDGCTPYTDTGHRLGPRSPLEDEKLRFSVGRNGALKFHKKITVTPKFEAREKLDENGEAIPNERRAHQVAQWGHSHLPENEMENVLLDEPDVRFSYEVDRDWWSRHGITRVKF